MKNAIWFGAAAAALLATSAVQASDKKKDSTYGEDGTGSNPYSHPVRAHERKDGTYVPPHHQTNPNKTERDNYGTQGNINPWTGEEGKKKADY